MNSLLLFYGIMLCRISSPIILILHYCSMENSCHMIAIESIHSYMFAYISYLWRKLFWNECLYVYVYKVNVTNHSCQIICNDWRLTTMTTTSNGIRKERKLKKRRERQWEIDNIITWAYLSFAFLRTVISMLMYGYILDDTLLFNIISLLYMHTRRRKRKKKLGKMKASGNKYSVDVYICLYVYVRCEYILIWCQILGKVNDDGNDEIFILYIFILIYDEKQNKIRRIK